jgi:Lar family restriction alleviation protein
MSEQFTKPPEPLKPCPFCGDAVVWLAKAQRDSYFAPDAYSYYGRCRSCACQGPWHKSDTAAARAWNQRKASPARGAG